MKTLREYIDIVSEAARSYKEIEFVCVNSGFDDATNDEKQLALKQELQKIPGVVVLHQDWSEGDNQQLSLAAIVTDRENYRTIAKTIRQLAAKHGIAIDMINDVDDNYVDRAITGRHPNQVQ